MIYAGIGSRETPREVQETMTRVARDLSSKGWTLSSGAAGGADMAFETGAGKQVQIWLPWKGFNGHPSELCNPSNEAKALAGSIHPAWNRCNAGAQKLHARNMHQILGADLNTPVQFVLCWTKDGKDTGGTGQAIRLAWSKGVKVINMFYKGWEIEMSKITDVVTNDLNTREADAQVAEAFEPVRQLLRVVNIKYRKNPGWDRVYCGRPGKGEVGTFGNPFWMSNENERDEVCDKFEKWLHNVVAIKGEGSADGKQLYQGLRSLYKRVKAGERIELACFCAPKRCHCESIKNFIESKI